MDNISLSGKELREQYLLAQNPSKLSDYHTEIEKMLNEMSLEIKDNIDKGKPPIAIRDTSKSGSGILVNNNKLENMIKDYLFTMLLSDEADKRGLKVDIQAAPIGIDVIDAKTNQPVLSLVIACTFK